MRARLLFALLSLLALAAFAPGAAAQTSVYHIRGNASAGSNNIWHINLTTGVETAVYTGYPGGNAATLAQRPSDGMLFYVINDASGENGAVYRFNPATPSVGPVLLGNIGPSTSGGDVGSGFRMAFSPAGTLYYMPGGNAADNDRLYTINQTTGRATPGGNITGTGNGGDMAFSTTGTLYIINQDRQLYTASTAGGAATLVGTVTFPGGATPGTLGLGVDGTRILIQTQSPSNMYAVTLPSLSATLLDTLGGGTTSTGDLSTGVIPAPSLTVTKTDGVRSTIRARASPTPSSSRTTAPTPSRPPSPTPSPRASRARRGRARPPRARPARPPRGAATSRRAPRSKRATRPPTPSPRRSRPLRAASPTRPRSRRPRG